MLNIRCDCGNGSRSLVTGKDSLRYTFGERQHDTHSIDGFEFGFHKYNQTLVITCKVCGEVVNIDDCQGSLLHYKH